MESGIVSERAEQNLAHQSISGRDTNDPGVKAVKRRTRTGCLTCRKRRVKCGEERPVCGNCLRSKRACLGYSQVSLFTRNLPSKSQTAAVLLPRVNDNLCANHDSQQTSIARHEDTEKAYSHQPLASAHSLSGTKSPIEDTRPDQNNAKLCFDADNDTKIDTIDDMFSQESSELFASLQDDVEFLMHHDDQSDVYDLSRLSDQKLDADLWAQCQSLYDPDPSSVSSTVFGSTNTGWRGSNSTKTSVFADDPTEPSMSRLVHNEVACEAFSDEQEARFEHLWDEKVSYSLSSNLADSNTTRNDLTESISIFEEGDSVTTITHGQQSLINSPLLDERSQSIFKHYMTVTAPAMGTFDRRETVVGVGCPKTFWIDGLPAMALSCHALAHAILAVSAMHMFKRNIGNENIAIKHFTQALKRVGRKLTNPGQRLEVSTLGTVLLLGKYEIMAGDHSRWNLHLSGARKLIMEHNYAAMNNTVRQMMAEAEPLTDQNWLQDDWQTDHELVTRLMGCEVNYDTQSQRYFENQSPQPEFGENSLADLHVLTDLYWWYCRHDVFVSMLSGDRLLLPYAQWRYCPPRGPLGNGEAVHATLDHLWLIMARLVDFGAKDLKRKKELADRRVGLSVPVLNHNESTKSESASATSSPNHHSSQTDSQASPTAFTPITTSSPPQPKFYGMMPPSNSPIKTSSSFDAMTAGLNSVRHPSIEAESDQFHDLEDQTQSALQDHGSIVEAFDLFESSLGPDFQPLPLGDVQINTPFGPAIQYKSPIIAAMWTFFLVGRILLRRLHPHSPAAATVSTSVNAHFTYDHAQTIGRIYGGLYIKYKYLLQEGHADSTLAGAVVETIFSLLFAAVQYQDPVQRDWTINSLNDMVQITGWQTAAAIAAACEANWERAGLAGRGLPYERKLDRSHPDDRVNGKYRFGLTHSESIQSAGFVEENGSCLIRHERNLVDKYASTRAHWAFGVLSVDEDLQRMSLSDRA